MILWFSKAKIFGRAPIYRSPVWPTVSFLMTSKTSHLWSFHRLGEVCVFGFRYHAVAFRNVLTAWTEHTWPKKKKKILKKQLGKMSSSDVNPGSFQWMILNCNISPLPSAISNGTNASEFTEHITADYSTILKHALRNHRNLVIYYYNLYKAFSKEANYGLNGHACLCIFKLAILRM